MSDQCKCGAEIKEILRPNTPHHAELRCENDHFLGWLRSPKNIEKRPNMKHTLEKKMQLGINYCQFCARKKNELGLNETLTIDHTLPLSEGGKDTEINTVVLCTSCHKLKHWHRLYNYTHWIGQK